MKINNLVLTILVLVETVSVSAQKQYTISGKIPDKYNDSYVYLTRLNIESSINVLPTFTDSALINNGVFVFKGVLESDTLLYLISLKETSGSFIALDTEELKAEYVEHDPLGYFRVSGSVLNDQLTRFIEYPPELSQKVGDMMKKREELLAKNEWTMEDEAEIGSFLKIEASHHLGFISKLVKDNVNNPVGQYILVMLGGNIKKEVMDEIEPKLSEDVKQKLEANRIFISEMMNINQAPDSTSELVKSGNEYVDFEGETPSGDKTKLSIVIKSKKLILLDFWASWCAPCLKEIPEIADLYDKYKDKGFEIVGISLDNDRTTWKNKIKNKNMIWFQFIDSNMSNLIKDTYGVKAIPHTVLIDENGIIIANKLRGKELRDKIEMLLSE
jgi:thiol-disulfide isomerase/thioredoxin